MVNAGAPGHQRIPTPPRGAFINRCATVGSRCTSSQANTMNDEQKGDKARRMDILKAQAELTPYVVFIPESCLCPHCGFDFVDYPEAYEKWITGCPTCHWSYCE